MRIVDNGDFVHLDVSVDVHRLPRDSAIGKSALGFMAKDDTNLATTIIHFRSKRDYDNLKSYEDLDKSKTIFLFDRFDLFQTEELWDYLNSTTDRCILVDCKNDWKYYKHSIPVDIILTAKGVTVCDKVSGRR